MTTSFDVVVVGGGIIGLMTARALNKTGASVAIIDKNHIGRESSWAGGGILSPLYPWRQSQAITRLVIPSLSLYPVLDGELNSQTGISPEWYPCGLLITQNPDIDLATEWCLRNYVAFREEPCLPDGVNTETDRPLWLPEIANIRNPRLIKSLKQDLLQRSVKLVESCAINGVSMKNQKISAIDTDRGKFSLDQAVLTTGAWTPDLINQHFPILSLPAPNISPVKGQMLLFKAEPDILPMIILDGDQYLIPRMDGHILAGSTVENCTFDKSVTFPAKQQLSEFAFTLYPALRRFPIVNHWAGIRPGSPNGIPYIDRHPEIDNLFINAGHFRNGLAMAPASAQLVTDLMLGRPASVDSAPYRINRPA